MAKAFPSYSLVACIKVVEKNDIIRDVFSFTLQLLSAPPSPSYYTGTEKNKSTEADVLQ